MLILTRPEARENLFLYIVMSNEVVGTILIAEKDGEEKLVYYTSKVLHDTKVQYQKIKKLAYAVVLASKKL